MNNYEINEKTMAIIPITEDTTQVIEEDKYMFINQNSFEIIDHSCKFFGSSYVGRQKGAMEMLGISYKTPIIVEETQNIILFPTSSFRSNDCCWISLNKVSKCEQDSKKSKVYFKNGEELELDISIGSLKNQILKSTMLDSTIRKRRNS